MLFLVGSYEAAYSLELSKMFIDRSTKSLRRAKQNDCSRVKVDLKQL